MGKQHESTNEVQTKPCNIYGVSNNEALELSEGVAVCEHEWTTNEESDIPFALKCIKCGIDG